MSKKSINGIKINNDYIELMLCMYCDLSQKEELELK